MADGSKKTEEYLMVAGISALMTMALVKLGWVVGGTNAPNLFLPLNNNAGTSTAAGAS